MHLQEDMIVAHQNHLRFKFKLKHIGGKYSSLEPPVYITQKFWQRDREGIIVGQTKIQVPLNYKVESTFVDEFCFPTSFSMFRLDAE
jgi:hypothetical protein